VEYLLDNKAHYGAKRSTLTSLLCFECKYRALVAVTIASKIQVLDYQISCGNVSTNAGIYSIEFHVGNWW